MNSYKHTEIVSRNQVRRGDKLHSLAFVMHFLVSCATFMRTHCILFQGAQS
jgi:hypothetical protein